jgi:hypothetical protein
MNPLQNIYNPYRGYSKSIGQFRNRQLTIRSIPLRSNYDGVSHSPACRALTFQMRLCSGCSFMSRRTEILRTKKAFALKKHRSGLNRSTVRLRRSTEDALQLYKPLFPPGPTIRIDIYLHLKCRLPFHYG